jgi:hypothetical protein
MNAVSMTTLTMKNHRRNGFAMHKNKKNALTPNAKYDTACPIDEQFVGPGSL